ncbi:hypothetical protein GOPIP_059_01050 [Gordonia polyisoprenivorans NBRC 16320 = JCM 10675]|nr:hypothetical protein GOPIP_059_01050 [Gordonia polyisoprenivorans NBRC 16320 = JCM 10675]
MRGRVGANRGRREALTLTAVLSIGALVLSVFGVLERGEAAQPPESRTLGQMAAPPEARWSVDAASLFGKDFDDASVSVEAADDHLLVRVSRNRLGRPSAVLAIDPDTGRPLWRAPRIGWENSCAISRDKRLACTRMARDGAAIVTRVSFVDPDTGDDVATATIPISGSSRIMRAGDGFLVLTVEMENITLPEEIPVDSTLVPVAGFGTDADVPPLQTVITRFDSRGHALWTVRPPLDQGQPVVSEAANLVALSGFRGGVTVLRLDSGRLLHSADGREAVVIHRSGFVTSGLPGAGRDTIDFFDADGVRTGEISGWRISSGDSAAGPVQAINADFISVESNTTIGLASGAGADLRWTRPSQGSSLQMLGDRYVVTVVDEFSEDLSSTRRWTVLDARSGSRISGFTAGFGQGFVGFDGVRMILGGEADADQRPSSPALGAYDIRTGAQRWHLPAPNTAAHWQVVAGHLLLIDDGVDAGTRSSIVGYAA